jgi:hypothetical protein
MPNLLRWFGALYVVRPQRRAEEAVMRRMLAMLLGGVVVLASPAMAAPSPQVNDPRGDWSVPGQDVLTGRVSSVLVAGKPVLRGELTLAEAPVPGVVTSYRLGFMIGCEGWSFAYDWPGAAPAAKASLERVDFCAQSQVPKVGPDQTFAATFSTKGPTLIWQAPYTGSIKRGARADSFYAIACNGTICGAGTSDPVLGYSDVWVSDFASSSRATYVIGSDLPRR